MAKGDKIVPVICTKKENTDKRIVKRAYSKIKLVLTKGS